MNGKYKDNKVWFVGRGAARSAGRLGIILGNTKSRGKEKGDRGSVSVCDYGILWRTNRRRGTTAFFKGILFFWG